MTQEEINEILRLHKKWLYSETGGVRANLSDADLSCANLSSANLSGANLSGADLSCADLSGANLRGADLSCADLSCADLSCADLSCANLSGANLSGADLSCANLSGANLRCADLSGADLSGANLRGADLSGADLSCANLSGANLRGTTGLSTVVYNENTSFFAMQCPEKGAYIGYKKANGYIVELEITEDAFRSSSTTRKCRASKARVLSITDISGTENIESVKSNFDSTFIYTVGKIIEVPDFDKNRWNECSTGIHHFITRKEAELYR